MNGNRLTEISPLFKYLPALRQLLLHLNRLTNVTELCCKAFERLEVLDIGGNKIREIPIALVHYLANLNQLTLVNNDIEKLPPLLGWHKKLQSITVEGNPLKSIRRPVVAKGTVAILAFLKDKFVEGRDDVVEEWALARESTMEDYSQQDYAYNAQNYRAEQREPAA